MIAFTVDVGEVVVVEKLLTVGPSASKVTVKVWVAAEQLLPFAPPQLTFRMAGLIVMPFVAVHSQVRATGPIDNSGARWVPWAQFPTVMKVLPTLKD